MRTTTRDIEQTKNRVTSLGQLVASWKSDHEAAKKKDFKEKDKREFEDLLQNAIELFREIERFHEFWIGAVITGEEESCLEVDKAIHRLYIDCYDTFGKLRSMVDLLQFYDITFDCVLDFCDALEDMDEVVKHMAEPSTPIAKIPGNAAAILQSSFDASRHE